MVRCNNYGAMQYHKLVIPGYTAAGLRNEGA